MHYVPDNYLQEITRNETTFRSQIDRSSRGPHALSTERVAWTEGHIRQLYRGASESGLITHHRCLTACFLCCSFLDRWVSSERRTEMLVGGLTLVREFDKHAPPYARRKYFPISRPLANQNKTTTVIFSVIRLFYS